MISALQLLTQLLPFMIEDLWKRKMIHTIMDTIQYYASPPCENRPRVVRRLIPNAEEKEEMLMSDEDKLSKALNVEWRIEYTEMMKLGKKARKNRFDKEKNARKAEAKTEIKPVVVESQATTLQLVKSSTPQKGIQKTTAVKNNLDNTSVKFEGISTDKTGPLAQSTSDVRSPTPDRKTLASRSQSISQSRTTSRNFNDKSRGTLALAINFSQNSFQSGVFQSSEFHLNSKRTPTPKTWRGELIARR